MVSDCQPGESSYLCKDGVTTCTQQEVGSVWGPCDGYVLPATGATTGADACQCFSQGRWALDNLVPCFYTYNGEDIGAAVVYLASREAGYVTGQTLHVNGGMAMP